MSKEKNNYDEIIDIDASNKAKDSKRTIKRLIGYFLRQKKRLLLVGICLLMSSLFEILSPKVLGMAINRIYEGLKNGEAFADYYKSIAAVISALLLLYLSHALFSYLQQLLMTKTSQTLVLTIRKEINDKLTKLPLKFFDTHQKGEILSRITNDIETISDTFEESITQLISSIISIIGAIIMMIIISPILTMISVVTIILSFVIALTMSLFTEKYYSKSQETLGQLNGYIEDVFTGNLVVKAFGLEKKSATKNKKINDELYQSGKKASFLSYIVKVFVRLINHLGYVAIAVLGVVKVMGGTISIGDIQAFIQYVNRISEPTSEISYQINTLQNAVASAERVFEILDEEEEEPDPEIPVLPDDPKGNIRFEHIYFGYTDDKMLMQDVSIDVKAGSKVAIVGPTGAGKTTLVNLLERFYDPKSGRITLDGVDIQEMGRGELRALTAMVLQESWLFEGTIKENIAYGHEGASDEDVYEAAKVACADHFIRAMPMGYDTILSNDNNILSQGQRQILTIARAILVDPMILILDEATSSVDTKTEVEIQKAMDALMKNRTSFVIAHRLSTIKNADSILVMNNGSIIEQGTHNELLEKNGFYADLYNSQYALVKS